MCAHSRKINCCGSKTVESEIEWGKDFRRKKKEQRQQLEAEKRGCKAARKKKKKSNLEEDESHECCKTLDEIFGALNMEGQKYADPFKVIKKQELRERRCRKRKRRKQKAKVKIVNRDMLTHRQYINLLAQPRKVPQCPECRKPRKKRKPKKTCDNTEKKKCKCFMPKTPKPANVSPRIRQLALPNKRLVYANWCSYKDVLDAESIGRMETIIVGSKGLNLDCKDAAKLFRKCKKEQKKCKRSEEEKKKQEACRNWLKNEVNILADLIVHDFAQNPLEAENNTHIQLTNSMMATLRFKGYRIAPISRNTRDLRKKITLEIFDHISVWSHKKYEDAEFILRKAKQRRYERMLEKQRQEMLAREGERNQEKVLKSVYMNDKSFADSSLNIFNELNYDNDREVIETFLKLLMGGSAQALDTTIHNKHLHNVTYRQLLEKLRYIRDANDDISLKRQPVKSFSAEMMKWTKKKRPDQLSQNVRRAIGAVSHCLKKYFKPNKEPTSTKGKNTYSKKPSSTPDEYATLSSPVILPDIPTYMDPNEDMTDVSPSDNEENEEPFDQSMFVGRRDYDEEGDDDEEDEFR